MSRLALLKKAFGLLFDNVPFLGRLPLTSWSAWKKTSLQVFVTIVLAAVPVMASAASLLLTHREHTLSSAAAYATKNGELLLLSGGAVSPLLYMTAVRLKRPHPSTFVTSFPHGVLYLLSTVLVLIGCSIFIALRAVETHPSVVAMGANLAPTVIFPAAAGTYAFALFLNFTANFHRNGADDADATNLNRPSEDDFGAEWASRS